MSSESIEGQDGKDLSFEEWLAKKNPQLIQVVLAHLQEHLDLWRGADPVKKEVKDVK